MIQRENFIKDLFNPKGILNRFKEIEFEDFKTFIESVNKEVLILNKDIRCIIPIKSIEEFDFFKELITDTYLTDKIQIILKIKQDLLSDVFSRCAELKNKRFDIITDDIDFSRDDVLSKGYIVWTENNPLWVEIDINYSNIEEAVEKITNIYVKKRFRFFKLNFDFESFQDMKFSELPRLMFWLFQIKCWVTQSVSTCDEQITPLPDQEPIILYHKKLKDIFISKEFGMFINKQAFDEGEMLFDLAKNYKLNGETIPFKELNKLRQYIDIKIPEKLPHTYINFYHNIKIRGSINETPAITNIIGGALR